MGGPTVLLLGGVLGITVGFACRQLHVKPVVQTVLAALLGATAASLGAAVLWILRPPPEAGVLAVSFGLIESLATWSGTVLVGVILHAVLGWAGGTCQRL
jgi:hypothetical protein